MRSALFLALPFAVLAAFPALSQEAAAPEAEQAAPSLPAITVAAATTMALTDRVIAAGFVGPIEEVQVQPLIEGQPIEALLADVGDKVEAGQVLARLSKSSLELQRTQTLASLASARATIAQAEAQEVDARSSAAEAERVAERARKLAASGSSTQAAADNAAAAAVSATSRVLVAVQTLEAARAQLALAEAQLANVDLQLTRTEVSTPYAGEITARNAIIGSIATAAAQPMFVIIRDSALELRADVAAADLLRIEVGQKVALRTTAGLSDMTGVVRLVEPTIDTNTRLGRARISFEAATQVRSGMYVEAEVIIAAREALAIPLTAIGSDDAGSTVMLVRDGVVQRVPVTTGIRDSGMVEVTSGLAEGDLVVLKAGAFVRVGDKINPVFDTTGTN
jgi:HlyD family secretion protein